MVIVADDQLPGIADLLADFADVRVLPAERIVQSELKDADALLIRSVTRVDARILKGTGVRFVGTATAGLDHVDTEFLAGAGITVADAGGSNAPAVCEYVLTALLELARRNGRDLFDLNVGIVGVGQIGERLHHRLAALGVKTVLNDPPRAASQSAGDAGLKFVSLTDLLAASEVVSLHVPLTRSGPHPTAGLVAANEIERIAEGGWLINTSRGGVVDEKPLIEALEADDVQAVVDVWSNEPNPNPKLVRSAQISTPHVAGYAVESKHRAVDTVATALADWAGRPLKPTNTTKQRSLPISPPPPDCTDTEFLGIITRQAYDIARDHLRMQAMCSFTGRDQGEFFVELRNSYRMRNEFASFTVDSSGLDERRADLVRALGMRIE